jgi:glycine/serine hydroxymethyltransferase
MEIVGALLARVLRSPGDEAVLAAVWNEVQALTKAFPAPGILD